MENKPRIVLETARLPVTFHALKNHIVAVLEIGPNKTIGLRFDSPEHLLTFCVSLMEKAAITWPDNPLIKDYLE